MGITEHLLCIKHLLRIAVSCNQRMLIDEALTLNTYYLSFGTDHDLLVQRADRLYVLIRPESHPLYPLAINRMFRLASASQT